MDISILINNNLLCHAQKVILHALDQFVGDIAGKYSDLFLTTDILF